GDLGGPMNIGAEYRQNTPILYYSYDQNFLDYFGASGVAAVDSAFSVFNALTNVSTYTADLSEWPLEAKRFNYKAQSLELYDLKSMTMTLLAEQAGLAEPDRFTWTLRSRLVGPGGCPGDVTYTVIKRNFEPYFTPLDQLQPSSYVNGTLYTYAIIERCQGTPPLADAVEFLVDPLANSYTAIASWAVEPGGYFTGLTRDDIGGLRYMLRTNNLNIESAGATTATVTTNNSTQLLTTADYAAFVAAALTNSDAELSVLFPSLVITSSSNYWVNVVTTNVNYYFTNYPWDIAGTAAHLISSTNRDTNIVQRYSHAYGNLLTGPTYIDSLPHYTNGNVTFLTTTVNSANCGAYALPGQVCTNVANRVVLTNGVFGDYFIIPTNQCGVSIVSTQLTKTISVTNVIAVATNSAGATNVNGQQYSQSLVYSYPQNTFIIHPVTCPTNTAALRQGIERVQYVRRDYDSLFNSYFTPITNTYTLNAITNNTLYPQKILRTVTRPDFLITARDLLTVFVARSISFNSNNASAGLAGPGTLNPGNVFTFNKVGPIYLNHSPDFLVETNAIQGLIWGSFDGSTNVPVIYPNGTSILNLENQVLIQISPAGTALPVGMVGVNYTNAFSGFTVTGGTAPYVWSIAPTSASGLPAGLALSASSGVVSGVPAGGAAGIYDITIRLTDAGVRFVERTYTLTINP
ncbi:MAG: Ig domain-containing protein, partial [Verrucomicrobia bacterium]|nr:Ig domain-containing protein [Verrucomicrobiota bacterium]